MKVTIKTLQGKLFTVRIHHSKDSDGAGIFTKVDAEPSDSIFDLKTKIFESQSHALEHQKLIYSGNFLVSFV